MNVRATDLDPAVLLHFDTPGGTIQFAGQRALLLDAVALGLLRRELIQTLGTSGARSVLTRFGYAHGWRTAETMKDALPWDSEEDWIRAGAVFHTLQGLVRVELLKDPALARGTGEALWHDSYEAEQHLLQIGRSDEAVCWTLAGYASGYISRSTGREIICIEERCRGKGDAVCHV